MLVTLIGKEKMLKLQLPKVPSGNYWINDKTDNEEKNLINIEGKDGSWQVITNNNIKVINPESLLIEDDSIKIKNTENQVADRLILKEYNMYGIYIDELYILYAEPSYEDDFIHLSIKNVDEIYIGSGNRSDIKYENRLVSQTHAKIFFAGGCWRVENFDKKYGTFVNGQNVYHGQSLNNGDIIFIMGLKIIVLGDSIFVNNPKYNVKCAGKNIFKYDENVSKYYNRNVKNNISKTKKFFRAPRIVRNIEVKSVKIDNPPAPQNNDGNSIILALGTSMAMSVAMIVYIVRTIDQYMSKSTTKKEFIFQMVTYSAMLITMLLIPIMNVIVMRVRNKKNEKKRQDKYCEYIKDKIDDIDNIMAEQRRILLDNYISVEECINKILNEDSRLWERKPEDNDFLEVRLGIGEIPLKIKMNYSEPSFSVEDDNLKDFLGILVNKAKTLVGAPIVYSITQNTITAIISENDEKNVNMLKNIIIQLIMFQSYSDLKLVFLLDEEGIEEWEFAKKLPHVWSSAGNLRFFASEYNDMEEISQYIDEDIMERLQTDERITSYNEKKIFSPHYIVITNNYRKVENLKIIRDIVDSKNNIGASLICLTNDMTQLPNETNSFITLRENEGICMKREQFLTDTLNFTYNFPVNFNFNQIALKLFNIQIKQNFKLSKESLPQLYTFLEMYNVGLIEQLNILERWKKNDSTLSLKAPIGISTYSNKIILDVHEKAHGPHGLIAGSTGSGKSEFIITYILSLAVNYNPYDVSFILIDYKGGGLAGAFQKNNIKLPHLVGTITNIDRNGLNRTLVSIQSELRRRQIMFNEARNMTDQGTIDIYKYQKLYHDGIVSKPISHLFIICDEFAELKQQQPDFMDELISVSRIGRSLGVHLILATQKPAGIVNDQIRSNSRFAICLKVQNSMDSKDVIGTGSASKLKRTRTILYSSW